ncbi:coiled-coil domain-containing protein 173 [Cystoisospora suis]|uniref:Coiled-coil domain-containing protein 173 n=1 Tax=Cystoisospora suis TaxID=483139 RepID=A0A2C6KEB8_9APIC|nr:coiled-coil domain-containing protein 173 [Cystoisospora suis]
MASYGGYVQDADGTVLPYHGGGGVTCHPYDKNDSKSRGKKETILTHDEWNQIKSLISGGHMKTISPERATDAEKRREDHARSMKLVEGWSNTLQSNLNKRVEAKIKRLEDEENARILVDQQEAILKQRRRSELVQRAERMLENETERCRALRTGLMYSDWLVALKEQNRWKQAITDLNNLREDRFKQILEEAERVKLEKEFRMKEQHRQKVEELKKGRLLQFHESQQKALQAKQEKEEEGRLIREKAAADLERAAAQKQEKRLLHRQAQEDLLCEHLEMIRLRREHEEKERKELEAATKYAMEQERKDEVIKKRDEELRKEQARQRQILTDAQTAHLTKLREEEEKRLCKDVKEQERKAACQEENARLQKEAQQRMMKEHRRMQIQRKRELEEERKRQDRELTQHAINECKKALVAEEEARQERIRAYKETAEIQQQQILESRKRRHEEREEEKRQFNHAYEKLVEKETALERFTEECVQRAIDDGRDAASIVSAMNRYLVSSGMKTLQKKSSLGLKHKGSNNLFNLPLPSDAEDEEENDKD